MVSINSMDILPPPDNVLEPYLLIKCQTSTLPNEAVIELKGYLLTGGKVIGELKEIECKGNDGLYASDNAEYKRLTQSNYKDQQEYQFIAHLTPKAIEYIEELREKRPKKDIEFEVEFLVKHLISRVSTSHLHEIDISKLPEQLKSYLETLKVTSRGKAPESLIVYSHDPEFSSSRANMWILSGGDSCFLETHSISIKHTKRIPYDDWVHDFLPKLKAYKVMTIEIPEFEARPEHEHLAKAVEELKHAEEFLREGKTGNVLMALRNVLLNHLTIKVENGRVLREEIKEMVLNNVPQEAKEDYRDVIKALEKTVREVLQNHLSKFIHLDTGKLKRMPLKEDLEYLFLIVTGIVRYLAKLSSKE